MHGEVTYTSKDLDSLALPWWDTTPWLISKFRAFQDEGFIPTVKLPAVLVRSVRW